MTKLLFFRSLRSLCLCASVVAFFLSSFSSCTKKEQATQPDGYLVKVSLASNFNRALVERVRVVIDKSRGGQALDLGAATAVTTTISDGVTTETRVVSIDRDNDTEYVIEVPQSPFKQATSFQLYLASPGHSTRSFSVSVSLLHGTLGTIASIFKDQLPNGELISFAPGRKRELFFDFLCVANVSCLTDGGANQPPVFGSVAPQTINIKKESTLRIIVGSAAYDREGDTLTFAAYGEPMDAGATSANNASIDPISGLFTWTPAASHVRDAGWGVTFAVSDPTNPAVTRETTINVRADNSDPVWSPVGERFAVEGQTLAVPLTVYDPDNEPLAVSLDLAGLPAGANAAVEMDGGDGTFTWAPTSKDGRTTPYTVKLTARDVADAAAVLQFDVRVMNVNDLPVVTAPDSLTLKAGSTTVLTVSAADPDGDLVTLTPDFSALPTGYQWNSTTDPEASKTGIFTWNPSESDVREAPYVATFAAVDLNGGGTVKSVSLYVTSAASGNAAPTLSGPAGPQAEEGKPLAFAVTASDPEQAAVALTMDAGGLPAGHGAVFAVDGGAGTFSWTPATGTARGDAFRVTFTATDPANASTNLDVFISVSAPLAPPSVPTGLVATGGSAQVALTWDASVGAASYAVFRGTAPGGPYVDAGAPAAANFTDTGLASGTTYYYVAASVNPAGTSANSTEASAITLSAAPTGLAATGSNEQVALTWDASVGAASYAVFRGTAPGGPYVDAGAPAVANFTDTDRASGTSYYYVVSAVNASGAGAISSEVSGLTIPATPVGFAATGGNAEVALTWDASVGAASYAVFRGTAPGGPYVDAGTPAAPNFTDTGRALGTSYYYVVSAVNASGASANSSEVSGLTIPATPVGLAATGGNAEVALTWDASVGAASYAVFRGTAPGGPYVDAGAPTAANFTNTSLAAGTSYYFVVSAVNASGASANSSEASGLTIPAAPTGLVATGGPTRVSLTWDASIGATSYTVHRGTVDGGPYSLAGALPDAGFTDTGLAQLTPYYYVVRAVNASGSSGNSSEENATTLCATHSAFPRQVPNSRIWALAQVGCTIYMGGAFTTIGTNTGGGARISQSTGQLVESAPLAIGGRVFAAAPDDAGGWYIGGNFTRVGTTTRNYLARLNADGGLDPWNPNANGNVNALAVVGGAIYAGGAFTTVSDAGRNRLAAIDADGGLLPWDPNVSLPVYALAVSGGVAYVGGDFTTIGVVTRNHLAAIDTDGGLRAWDPNVPSGTVSTIGVSDGVVYVGGYFSTVGGLSRANIAAIDTDGGVLAWNPGSSGAIYKLAVSDGVLYATGLFTTFGGAPRNYLAAVDTDGGLLPWNPSASSPANGEGYGLAVSGSTVYVGGRFTTVGDAGRNGLAAIGTDGTLQSWNPNAGDPWATNAGHSVYEIAVSGGVVYAGGDFGTMGGTPRNRLAAFATDGTLQSWNPNANDEVETLAVSGTTVFAGGKFTTVADAGRNRLAAIDADGGLLPWDPNANGEINALAVNGTTVYVGGLFGTIADAGRNYVAAVDMDGGVLPWNPNANERVLAIAVSGGTIYLGGSFTTIADAGRNYLAAFDMDGGLLPWSSTPNGAVRALAVSGSSVYAGGDFTTVNGQARCFLAGIDTDGGLLVQLPYGACGGSTVWSVAVRGTTLYAGGGGTFLYGDGKTRNYVAALNPDGTFTSWDPSPNSPVYAILPTASTIYVGGDFTAIGGGTSSFFAPIDAVTGLLE